jgi:putative ABC transport system ATP-binding protein
MSPLTASAKGLFKTYHQAGVPIEVLRGLNLDIAEGETVAILGQSGSGKTTFLSMMAGLDRPDSGYVDLIGMNITAMSEKALTGYRAENLSIVFQQFHLMSYLSALENVMLPLDILARAKGSKIQSEEIAKDTLERVGLGSRLSHLPHQLSGGEKQRVAIARALVTRPKLLLADEPSGNLDSKTGDAVMRLLFDQVAALKMSLILVTHNEALAGQCQRRLQILDGVLQ